MGGVADSQLDESISSNSGAMGQKTEQQHRSLHLACAYFTFKLAGVFE
jgi:hypothetical protein